MDDCSSQTEFFASLYIIFYEVSTCRAHRVRIRLFGARDCGCHHFVSAHWSRNSLAVIISVKFYVRKCSMNWCTTRTISTILFTECNRWHCHIASHRVVIPFKIASFYQSHGRMPSLLFAPPMHWALWCCREGAPAQSRFKCGPITNILSDSRARQSGKVRSSYLGTLKRSVGAIGGDKITNNLMNLQIK